MSAKLDFANYFRKGFIIYVDRIINTLELVPIIFETIVIYIFLIDFKTKKERPSVGSSALKDKCSKSYSVCFLKQRINNCFEFI